MYKNNRYLWALVIFLISIFWIICQPLRVDAQLFWPSNKDIDTYTIDPNQTCTAIYQPYYFAADGHLQSSDASDPNMIAQVLSLAAGTGRRSCLRRGPVKYSGWSWSPGWIYLSEDPNTPLTQTAPTTSGAAVQALGWAADDPTSFYFNPCPITLVNK